MTEWNTKHLPVSDGPWITIGSFDGVHLGHQKLINHLVDSARKAATRSVVITFFPNPAAFLKHIESPFYLTSPEEKEDLLLSTGVHSILTLHFDEAVSRQTPLEFISMLHTQLHFSHLLFGFDFRLGAGREGDIQLLKALGKEMGFSAHAIKPVKYQGHIVSSSRIRSAISDGNILSANAMLRHTFSIEGEVIHGDGRGKHLGLPTANLKIWGKQLLPANGVYAAYTKIGDLHHPSVVSIGYRPTFYQSPTIRTIEDHILDFSGQIYGKQIKIQFIEKLRPEKKYDSVDKLMEQIRDDIITSREILSNDKTPADISA